MTRILIAFCLLCVPAMRGQGVPASLLGRWRVERVLTQTQTACWKDDRASSLLGSSLWYGPGTMHWQGGEVPLEGVLAVTRTLDRKEYAKEYGLGLETLGIRTHTVTEIDLQHEDADVTGGSTEVPGDTVLLAGPGRIVFSVCGVFYEAVRVRR